MIEQLVKRLEGLNILILGFGKEGKSSYEVLKKIIDPKSICIADENPDAFSELLRAEVIKPNIKSGTEYLKGLNDFDLIIKTPGIQRSMLLKTVKPEKITSQSDLFFRAYHKQIIGITGTKGKSSTTNLIYRILSAYTPNVVMVGNIGVPSFDLIGRISTDTHIVFELSAHQLDDVVNSPHIAVLLNIFEEHLDHYPSMENYRQAKYRISAFQRENDWLITDGDDSLLRSFSRQLSPSPGTLFFSCSEAKGNGIFLTSNDLIRFRNNDIVCDFDVANRVALKGEHNLKNIMAAIGVTKILGVPDEVILNEINNFKGLDHRMQYLGNFGGIDFYNDSIATIPEATIAALKTLQNVDTLILGGKDRGIDYSALMKFLPETSVRNFIFIGKAGERILAGLKPLLSPEKKTFCVSRFEEMGIIIQEQTRKGSVCLLSPAASSYDQFRNFEERGHAFKRIAESIFPPEPRS